MAEISLGNERLTDAQVDRALDAIWLRTPSPEKRSADSAKRAALDAYLTRLGPGTTIVGKQEKDAEETRFPAGEFHAEVLAPTIGYVRLGAFLESLEKQLEAALRDFEQLGVHSIVLDLRATAARGSLDLAGRIASYFLPEGTEVFEVEEAGRPGQSVRASKKQISHFRLLLLTGDRTAGPVEALAAALHVHSGALVIGISTQGQAQDFELVPLGGDTFLRMPVREALVKGIRHLVPDGFHPDIICSATPEETDIVLLREVQEGRVASLLKETERPKLNEAALLANKNPETEFWIQTQLKRKQPKAPLPPKDAALTMAMDFLAGWDALYGRSTTLP
jgi:C-terminal processing protease CtpA/Prc